MHEENRLAVACRNSGIGDMLCQLIHVMWYAEATGRRCYVDWIDPPSYSDPQTSGIDLFSTFFKCERIFSASTLHQNNGAHLQRGVTNVLSVDHRSSNALEPSIIEEFVCTGHDPGGSVVEFRRPLDFLPPAISSRLLQRVRLQDAITDTIDHPVETLSDCIGIHIRHGNGELFDNDGELELFAVYEKMIEHVLATTDAAELFLSTDSKAVENWFASRFGNFRSNSKFLPDDIALPIHHPGSTYGNPHVTRLNIFRDALRDMYALSKCRYLICDRSGSFTRAAKAWGNYLTEPDRLFEIQSPRKPFLARARHFWEDQNTSR